jgi:hypothetical protein
MPKTTDSIPSGNGHQPGSVTVWAVGTGIDSARPGRALPAWGIRGLERMNDMGEPPLTSSSSRDRIDAFQTLHEMSASGTVAASRDRGGRPQA